MVSIGDTTLPGVSATVDSASSVALNVSSPGDIALVGGADLSAEADASTVYRVTTPVRARQLFGAGSPLAENAVDALGMGAFPVYAAAADETDVAAEDISGIGSTSGTLENGPLPEEATAATFTVDGDEKTTIITLEDPSGKAPAEGEVYLNPVTRDFELDAAPSTSGTVDYTYHDYSGAIQAVRDEAGETVDFIGATTENRGVVDEVESAVDSMEGQKQFAIGVAGAASHIGDTSAYSNPYDNSRMLLLYPGRNADGESVVGSYLGLRAAIGIDRSAMKRRLNNQRNLAATLSRAERIDLDSEKVVVLSNESRGAMVVNDVTSVADDNTDESEMRDSLSRLIVDYVTEITLDISDQYIGGYHSSSNRNALRAALNSRLGALQDTNAIVGYTVAVEAEDAYTARVDLGVETVKPLRNVVANITAGEVEA